MKGRTLNDNNNYFKSAAITFGMPLIIALMASALVVLTLPFVLFDAWVLQKLWVWFVVPFHAPHINVWLAFGVLLVLRHIIHYPASSSDDKKDWGTILGKLFAPAFAAVVVLVLGYLIKGHIHIG